MKTIKYLLLALTVCFGSFLSAQSILNGVILGDDGLPLEAATVNWIGGDIGGFTDERGFFEIGMISRTDTLVISYVGYDPILFKVDRAIESVEIKMEASFSLSTIEVVAANKGNYNSVVKPLNVETINKVELCKAACCSLAESFETNNAVDVAYGDAVSGAKEIEMLGLRGVYTQMMIENRPTLRGLGTVYAMEYIPGTWLENIQISKGASTVVNGYESVTGQINVELDKPFKANRVFVNLFGNTVGRAEANLQFAKVFNEKWSTGLLLHGSNFQRAMDGNNDGYADMPTKRQLNGLSRWFYTSPKLMGQINLQMLSDHKSGGDVDFLSREKSPSLFGFELATQRLELYTKWGYQGFEKEGRTLAFIGHGILHEQTAFFGEKTHEGVEQNLYGNLIYQEPLKGENNHIRMGTSIKYEDYDEALGDFDLSRTEIIPGVFAEMTLNTEKSDAGNKGLLKDLTLILGARVDDHNLYGAFFTPRFHLKKQISDRSVFRLSAGKGFRSPNVVAENLSLLASSRTFDFDLSELDIEEAINAGVNFTQEFDFLGRGASINFDLYHTRFQRQMVIDRESSGQFIQFYQLTGPSYSSSFLSMLVTEPIEGLEVKLGYKWNDVKVTQNEELVTKPMVAEHRGIVTIDYNTRNDKWRFNTATQLVGSQRLPSYLGIEGETVADPFILLNSQVTYIFNEQFEVYVGGENLTNYTQENPILGSYEPNGTGFDATNVYAPVFGTRGYFGLRYKIK